MDYLGYHIVLTTHNSRTSRRMIKYNVYRGPARVLCLEEEILLTKMIGDIINENGYRCTAYNICGDHVHMIIVCQEGALSKIVQKIKSVSSKLFHRHSEVSAELTALHNNRLWSQKFFRAQLDEWQIAKFSKRPGEIYQSSYLANAMFYIKNNRAKHQLKSSVLLEAHINDFIMSEDKAYGIVFNGS